MDKATRDLILKIAGGAVSLIIIYFLVIRPILKKLGILDDNKDKARDKQTEAFGSEQDSPFSPGYYKTVKGAVLMTREAAEKLAEQIYDAVGVWHWGIPSGDDEAAVYGALRQLKAKTQLSWLADVFNQKYQKDLYLHLVDNFDDDEIEIVNSIAKNLL